MDKASAAARQKPNTVTLCRHLGASIESREVERSTVNQKNMKIYTWTLYFVLRVTGDCATRI